MAMLDLVALATVADVAPLVGVNRAFVRQGLAIMSRRRRPGLVALSDVARLDGPPGAFHLGFLLGPRINAGGRVGRADLGALCLSCRDPREAGRLAAELDGLNRDRRAIEAAVRDANGTVVPLPEPPAERIPCGPDECDLIANGHKPHWIPVLRAGNGPKEDWLPITVIEHDGTKLVFSTEDGVYTCYNHDPERLANAKYYNREWPVMRGDFDGHGYPVSVVSSRPIGPCSHA